MPVQALGHLSRLRRRHQRGSQLGGLQPLGHAGFEAATAASVEAFIKRNFLYSSKFLLQTKNYTLQRNVQPTALPANQPDKQPRQRAGLFARQLPKQSHQTAKHQSSILLVIFAANQACHRQLGSQPAAIQPPNQAGFQAAKAASPKGL